MPRRQASLALDDHAHKSSLHWLEVNLMVLDDKLLGLDNVGIVLGGDAAVALAIGRDIDLDAAGIDRLVPIAMSR